MKELSILVLAGSNSKRFGKKKAFFKIDGKPMIQHVVERISNLSDEILISCKSDHGKLTKMFPLAKVIRDKSVRKGALTGLVSSLPEVRSKYVAIATCDCPRIKPEVLRLLLRHARGHDGGIPRWPNDYIEPLQAVYRTEKLKAIAQRAWENGKMKLTDVLEMVPDVVYVSTEEIRKVDPKLESFLNVNTPKNIDTF